MFPLNGPVHNMNSCKVMLAQSKGMKSTWSTARGSGAGCVKFQGDKKRPAKGNDLNALVVNTVKLVLKLNKHKRDRSPFESGSEEK